METLIQTALRLAPLQPHHYPQVRSIYEQGLATGNASFETQASDWQKWDSSHLPYGRTVALSGDQVAGWVALTPVSGRCVYQGVAEVSVYVHPAFQGQGVGRQLLAQLIQESKALGLWTLQAGSSRKTPAVWRFTKKQVFGWWAGGRKSASGTACGGMCSCWSGAAP